MPIAKEAPQPVITRKENIAPAILDVAVTHSWENVPIDTIRYFNQDIGTMSQKTIEQLRDIDKWSQQNLEENTIGNRLQKIRHLESKLGSPALNETKVQKMWNWIKMQTRIDELRKRQEAHER